MKKENLPRVLVIGINAWRTDGCVNTLMNIFSCWDPEKLALIYTRADLPNTPVCSRFFQISESQVLKSVFKPWLQIGRQVENTSSSTSEEALVEHGRYAFAHRIKSSVLPFLREFVWLLGHWKTESLRKFVFDFDPDVLFIPIYPTVFMGRIQKYIIKLTKKPTVCYLADDNYSYSCCSGAISYLHRFWLRQQVGPLARGCKQMFVIVDKEKEDTDARFGTDAVILTKSVDFSEKGYHHHNVHTPLKFVYTGSLLIGRDRTLSIVADAINEINTEGTKAELYIYSQTTPDSAMMKKLNRKSSKFCGQVSRDEVQRIQQDADVVIFAEALDGKEAHAAKLSFSTKITDYLSNGKCILAIGKSDIAPIDYFRKNNAAVIANNAAEIYTRISEIVANPAMIDQLGQQAFNCAIRNHDAHVVSKRFINTICKAIQCDHETNLHHHDS